MADRGRPRRDVLLKVGEGATGILGRSTTSLGPSMGNRSSAITGGRLSVVIAGLSSVCNAGGNSASKGGKCGGDILRTRCASGMSMGYSGSAVRLNGRRFLA